MNKQMAALLLVASLGVGSAWSTEREAPASPASPAEVILTWLGTYGIALVLPTRVWWCRNISR